MEKIEKVQDVLKKLNLQNVEIDKSGRVLIGGADLLDTLKEANLIPEVPEASGQARFNLISCSVTNRSRCTALE